METVIVTHALGRYPVYLGAGGLHALADLVPAHFGDRRVALITDTTVGRLYEEWESGAKGTWREGGARAAETATYDWVTRLSFAAGEASKTRDTWATLTDALLDHGLGRDSAILAIGGGVVGDVAGFVAATYARGIPFMLVPTTLVAMLDASIGGKTGVDTPVGKNLIGAFHQPTAILADPLTLRSLPDREYRSGLAEAVKHGLIADAAYLAWIEREAEAILRREPETLVQLIRRSVEIKAEVVGADERENGRRAVLNAGHTVAHALEHVSEYRLAHGEAVALGLVAECDLAERMGVAAPGLRGLVEQLLARLGLPTKLPTAYAAERVVAAMAIDKKNRGARIHCALPSGPGAMANGNGRWTVPVDGRLLTAVLEALGPGSLRAH